MTTATADQTAQKKLIKLRCSRCGNAMRVRAKSVRAKVQCDRCRKTFRIPQRAKEQARVARRAPSLSQSLVMVARACPSCLVPIPPAMRRCARCEEVQPPSSLFDAPAAEERSSYVVAGAVAAIVFVAVFLVSSGLV